MTEFRYINWYNVANAMGSALLISQTQEEVRFGLHPYGNIVIANNGHEVNIFWSHIPGLTLALPASIEVWEYKLKYSIPLNSMCPQEIAAAIKAAINEECAKAIAQQKAIVQEKEIHTRIKTIAEREQEEHQQLLVEGIASN